ncbi:TIGR01777 family oxidoreductase [Streptosporangium sp. NBC_01755]|uniref:TIGR01777 family oxidoreductase n=1 Tax=unclassified Streptosporangium TaxID=2632669 RepID=UPI002DD91FFD|nr:MULTISPECIES: TIGR01777 family oxidoreductase [unclassified Streptosporangium]WSA23009.1 TIGR01777 family oxidoreductase [Streptosporangium sp. NBC_01810]WSC98848.1 TIGR01777 family oxidoreductase [Streptosporangium sp. NBC_01755]
MTIIVTGSSGLLGSALVKALRDDGARVVRLVRRVPKDGDESFWDPAKGVVDPAALEGAEAVIHLAGAGIGDRRWSDDYKREVVRSRVEGTRTLVGALAGLAAKPVALLSGSAIGFYGDTGEASVDESAPAGAGFLAQEVVVPWEAETAPAEEAGIRVVRLRTGLVLSGQGGMLSRLLPVFRLGLGAPLGSGRQYWSWISIDDWVLAVQHILRNSEISGPVNLTAPEPVTNAEFTKVLGAALHRPTLPLAVPGFVLRTAIGGFAEEGALTGQRVLPRRLLDSGYAFRHIRLDEALSAVL